MIYSYVPYELSPCASIADDEVQAARKRLVAKHGLAYAARRGWLDDAQTDKMRVNLRVIRKDGNIGKFAQLWQKDTLIREAYIYPTTNGEYRSVGEFVASMRRDYIIENLPSLDDKRYYVRYLAAFQSNGTMAMGCLTDSGKHVECYTVDDLIAIGFA